MKRRLFTGMMLFAAAIIATIVGPTALRADSFSFTGTFETDDQVQLVDFTLTTDGIVTFQTYGYGGGTNEMGTLIPGGGFQNELSWFASDGTLFGSGSSGCGSAGAGNSGFCLDAYVDPFLPAGTYTLALTQAGNDPVGNLSQGFTELGQGNFTVSGLCPAFCGVFGDQDNGNWAVDISNVNSAVNSSSAPEPETMLLTGCGLVLIGLAKRRHVRQKNQGGRPFVNHLFRLLLSGLVLLPIAAFAQTVPLAQDSYVVTSPPTGANFGSAVTINVTNAATSNGSHALVQFDLTSLPPGTTAANIAYATLTLFVKTVGAAGSINVAVANGTWTEAGVTGNNAPVAGAAVASGVAISAASTDTYLSVDVTAAVQSWLNGTTNSGFILTPNDSVVGVAFDSKESTTTGHQATLNIVMASASPADVSALQSQVTSLQALVTSLQAKVSSFQASLQQQGSFSIAGMYSVQDISQAENTEVNPFTGQLSCPAGFTPREVARVKGSEPPMYGVTVYLCIQ